MFRPTTRRTGGRKNGKGKQPQQEVIIKQEPETVIWSLETEEELFTYNSKEVALINYVGKDENKGKGYRSMPYKD